MFDDMDTRILTHHDGDVQLKRLACGVSPGMNHAGTRMRRLKAT